jgi:hypothetical protein
MRHHDSVLNATIDALGLFDFRRFVLRLAPDLHLRLEEFSPGIVTGPLNREDLLASSVYLHETWHWWQHAGTTFWFLSGMVNPVQTHANTKHLKAVLASLGAKKSIYQMLVQSKNAGGPKSPFGVAYIIVNSFADLRTYRAMCTHPEKAREIVSSPLFEAKGHGLIKLLDSPSDRHILQIYDASETRIKMTILAIPAYRLEPTADTRFTFSELPNGQALATWFYPGDKTGLEFSVMR